MMDKFLKSYIDKYKKWMEKGLSKKINFIDAKKI